MGFFDKLKKITTNLFSGFTEADVLYGVTMQEQGVSKILTINMNDLARELKIQ